MYIICELEPEDDYERKTKTTQNNAIRKEYTLKCVSMNEITKEKWDQQEEEKQVKNCLCVSYLLMG